MTVISIGLDEQDATPIEDRLQLLVEMFAGERGFVMLAGWAQNVINDVHLLLMSNPHPIAPAQLEIFEKLQIWKAVSAVPGEFKHIHGAGPILASIALNELRLIVTKVQGRTELPGLPTSTWADTANGCTPGQAESPAIASFVLGENEVQEDSYAGAERRPPASSSRKRSPDYALSERRQALFNKLMGELATIFAQGGRLNLAELKQRYKEFEIWEILSATEQQELLTEDFKPKVFAAQLVLRKFGLTSAETLKADRRKLKHRRQVV